jgi:hypothetical protein
MSAWFKRDIERGAFGSLAGLLQRHGLGMGTSTWRGLTAAESVAVGIDNYGAYGWIRPGLAEATPRQHQRLGHVMEIGRAHIVVRARGSILN